MNQNSKPTQDINIERLIPLVSPQDLKTELQTESKIDELVFESRELVKSIIANTDSRFLVIAGPCSIHDEKAAVEYASRLQELQKKFEKHFAIVMRVYFEKPRTTIGWKGLINDPRLDGSCDMIQGLRLARELMLKISRMGLPIATEVLDPIIPQYISDLVSWAAIGARTTESQTHREMASGLSMPVGFKNNTDGSMQVAVEAMQSSRNSHSFLGIDQSGKTCIFNTKGNQHGHIILRGGRNRPNYDPESIKRASQFLSKAGLPPSLMVDCSHANSGKKHENQEVVWNAVMEQRAAGNHNIIGVMLESFLEQGNQKIPENLSDLQYGVSITDECIGWNKTAELLESGYKLLTRN